MIKTTPQKLITQGTDWRFLTELKRELKGYRWSRSGRSRDSPSPASSRR